MWFKNNVFSEILTIESLVKQLPIYIKLTCSFKLLQILNYNKLYQQKLYLLNGNLRGQKIMASAYWFWHNCYHMLIVTYFQSASNLFIWGLKLTEVVNCK